MSRRHAQWTVRGNLDAILRKLLELCNASATQIDFMPVEVHYQLLQIVALSTLDMRMASRKDRLILLNASGEIANI